jgi:hypothetical protein
VQQRNPILVSLSVNVVNYRFMNVFTRRFPRRWSDQLPTVAQTFLLLLSVLATIASCQQEAPPACGCEGPAYSVLTNQQAVYKQGMIYSLDRSTPLFASPCNPEFVKEKVADGDTVLVSGRTHSSCFKGESLIAIPGLLEVTAIRKQ